MTTNLNLVNKQHSFNSRNKTSFIPPTYFLKFFFKRFFVVIFENSILCDQHKSRNIGYTHQAALSIYITSELCEILVFDNLSIISYCLCRGRPILVANVASIHWFVMGGLLGLARAKMSPPVQPEGRSQESRCVSYPHSHHSEGAC